MAKKAVAETPVKTPAPVAPRQKPSVLLDTRVIYCGDWHASHYVKVTPIFDEN